MNSTERIHALFNKTRVFVTLLFTHATIYMYEYVNTYWYCATIKTYDYMTFFCFVQVSNKILYAQILRTRSFPRDTAVWAILENWIHLISSSIRTFTTARRLNILRVWVYYICSVRRRHSMGTTPSTVQPLGVVNETPYGNGELPVSVRTTPVKTRVSFALSL